MNTNLKTIICSIMSQTELAKRLGTTLKQLAFG